jgi:hypothetical protein
MLVKNSNVRKTMNLRFVILHKGKKKKRAPSCKKPRTAKKMQRLATAALSTVATAVSALN